MRYHLANLLLAILPPTRWFKFKAFILSLLGVRVGRATCVCGGVKFFGGGKIIIGDECWIGLGTRFYSSPGADIVIADRCDIAPEVSFMCGTHKIGDEGRRAGIGQSTSINVQAGSWVGIGATLLGGCTVGEASIVAARALLLGQTYPAHSMLTGAPATIKRSLPTIPTKADRHA